MTLGKKLKSYETLVWSTPRARIFHGSVTVDIENLQPGTVIRYTTDGSIPTESSAIWEGAITIDATTNFKLLAFAEDGSNYKPYDMVYTSTDLKLSEVDLATTQPGMFYRYYELDDKSTRLPDFENLEPTRTDLVNGSVQSKHSSRSNCRRSLRELCYA